MNIPKLAILQGTRSENERVLEGPKKKKERKKEDELHGFVRDGKARRDRTLTYSPA